jgi:hypothetical protein
MVETKAKMVPFWIAPGMPMLGAKEGVEKDGGEVQEEDNGYERGQA